MHLYVFHFFFSFLRLLNQPGWPVFDNLNEYHLNLGDRRSTLFLISLCTFPQDLRMMGLILTEVACSIEVYGEAPRLRSDWSGRSIPDFYDPNLDKV